MTEGGYNQSFLRVVQVRDCVNQVGRDEQSRGLYLLKWNAPRQQLNEVSGFHNGVWIECLLGGADGDTSLDQVQRAFDVLKETRFSNTRTAAGSGLKSCTLKHN